jgi:putative transposase
MLNIKNKNKRRIERKIKNRIDDLQWKTIKYLTDNYSNILLGDMSAKSIIKRGKSKIFREMKDACERTRFYQFRLRLQNKCEIKQIGFKVINECYTSKTCSKCGNYNDKLKGEKVYKCKKCKNEIDRDVNACRNIYFKMKI